MGLGLGLDSAHHTWLAHLYEAQRYLPESGSFLALLVFINIPVIAVVLNVLHQLVRPISFWLLNLPLMCYIGLSQRPVITPRGLLFHTLLWINNKLWERPNCLPRVLPQ